MLVKVSGGWKIRSHKTGKIYPKVYKTKDEAERRTKQLEWFGNGKKAESKKRR